MNANSRSGPAGNESAGALGVQQVLELFDRLRPLEQLDRLMLMIGMPPQHRPPDTLSIFRRQDAIVAWALNGGSSLLVALARALEYLIEKQASITSEAPSVLSLSIRVLLEQNRDPLHPVFQSTHVRCRVGDAFSIKLVVSDDCYVTVLCTGTTGHMYCLFPNVYHRDPRVRAAHTYDIPAEGFPLTEGGPPGVEIIRAIASRKPHFIAKIESQQLVSAYTESDLKELENSLEGYGANEKALATCIVNVLDLDSGVPL